MESDELNKAIYDDDVSREELRDMVADVVEDGLILAILNDDISREELRDMVAAAAPPIQSHWDEVPGHPLADWRYEVANGDTMLGYADWCAARDTWGDSEDGGDS